MLRSEPIIGYERIGSSARSDVADEIAVCAGGSQVEPAPMQVQDRRSLSRPRRFRPPAGDPSTVSLRKSRPWERRLAP